MSSIRFITAPIGGGKSLFATIQICKELERTDRFIVTNVPLILQITEQPQRLQRIYEQLAKLAAARSNRDQRKIEDKAKMYWTIAEYCDAFIRRPIDVSRRLCCLTEEQSRQFWRYVPTGELDLPPDGVDVFRNDSEIRPSRGFILPNLPDALYKEVPDFTFRRGREGCYYVLDEVHQLFSSRLWQQTGPQAERYMSQLRKLNDDLDLVTQHPEKVDKNFRRNATDWIQVQNMSKSPLFMGVTFAKKFRCHEYQQAEMPQRFDKPTRTTWYSIEGNRRYEWLYKTAEGVGVSGGIVAEDSRFKGLHWSVWLIAVALICVAAYFFPRVIMDTTQRIVMSTAGAFQGGITKGIAASTPNNPAFHGNEPKPATPAPRVPQQVYELPPGFIPSQLAPPAFVAPSDGLSLGGLYCKGVMFDGKYYHVFLSDGRVADGENGEVQDVGRRYVRVFGLPKIPIKDAD
jgi:hypothetical protein